jgi:membrane fusion protein (multidrug efflux system)
MNIQRHVLVLVAATAVLTSCSKKQAAAPPPPEVATVTISCEPVLLTTELPGRTSPYRVAEIRPRVSGLIQKRLFTEGADVKEGDVLYLIDEAPFKASLDNAEAALARAKANLSAVEARVARYQKALLDKAVSKQDYDDASAALKQVRSDIAYYEASVETARINLGYTRVVAPITGRIGRSSVTDGAIVMAYQAASLASIQQLDPIYVDVPQSTTALLELEHRLKEGNLNHDGTNQNKVQLVLEDGTVYPLEGTLEFREVTVDPTTGSVILRAVFPNPNGVLLPSMFVRALVKEGVKAEGILVPQQSVGRDTKGTPFAWVVDKDGKVERRVLSVDRTIGAHWLVSSGLKPGEHVVAEGLQRIRPGAVVKEVAWQPETPAPGPRPVDHGKEPVTLASTKSASH